MKQATGLDVRGISAPPTLFCTIHGDEQENTASVEVVRTLMDHPACNGVSCRVFASAAEYREECAGVPPERIVVFFDQVRNGRCFRPLFRGTSERLFPVWSARAWWGVTISPDLCAQKRVHSAVQQVAADFRRNFLKNIQNGWLPFGPSASEDAAIRRRGKKVSREKRRLLNRASWLGGVRDPLFL